jgi:DNA repair exonuclease SbcCD ATPase subunit
MTAKRLVPWIGYPGSTLQNTYAEDLEHGYLVWDIDTSSRRHTVEFSALPNPKPFVTIDWAGSADATFDLAISWPNNSRFRVRSSYMLPSSDAASLGQRLRKEKNASEVVFKSDDEAGSMKFASASLGVDVCSLEAMERMLREYYSEETLDDATWQQMLATLADVHPRVTRGEELNRGTHWTLKEVEWDNLYGYGQDNKIDFSTKHGVVGIFGPNRIGKSSVVGTIMYSLFNSSDRDVGKNAFVVNLAKKSGSARSIINVAGSDHEIKRSTIKVVSRGLLTANTSLTVKQLDGDQTDLTGEQRGDTEKNLRKLIGTYEDFAYTSGQVQDDVGRFLKEGATQRKAILSRFLGIDVFEKLYTVINDELSVHRNKLKNLPAKDDILAQLAALEKARAENFDTLVASEAKRHELEKELREERLVVDTLQSKVDARRAAHAQDKRLKEALEKERSLVEQIVKASDIVTRAQTALAAADAELARCSTWEDIDVKRSEIAEAKLALQAAKSASETSSRELERSRKVALKLLDVPCGDQFPTCVYIKDAHVERGRVDELAKSALEGLQKHDEAYKRLLTLGEKEIDQLVEARKQAEKQRAATAQTLANAQATQLKLQRDRELCRQTMEQLSGSASSEDDDVEQRYDDAVARAKQLDDSLLAHVISIKFHEREGGKQEANAAQLFKQLDERDVAERESRTRELLVNAFSRRGIPNIVLGKLLPTLNAEMDKVLDGVINFRVLLRADDDTNALDILIDDGVARPLELGSGMERFVGGLALRVALSNLTTLPKPDFMIIDEGFGSLDETNAVACVSIIRSLKRWFRFILVVSHIDIIKDAVDMSIEIEKVSDSARVQA